MDVVERLTLEAAQAATTLACEHRQRYAFAAGLCAGQRVLDLCCGSGYGSVMLAATASSVVGVDNDAATVETARVTAGRQAEQLEFELGDAVSFLGGDIAARFDAIVCFDGLGRLREPDHALRLMLEHARRGVRIVASIANDKLLSERNPPRERNPDHVTEFGYDEAQRAFASFPSVVMVPQFLAEGALICPSGATETEVEVSLEDRHEPEYANHFIFCAGFAPEAVQGVHHGRIALNTSPVFNRWAADLERGTVALRRENARLARARLGKDGSAAATALAAVNQRETQIAVLTERCQTAEAKVAELQLALADAAGIAGGSSADGVGVSGGSGPSGGPGSEPVALTAPLAAVQAVALVPGGDGDPNSWEMRRRRAREVLMPWIERTVSLEGKTVLEYGAGNAAVSCAFAERAERVIGVDINPDEVAFGQREVGRRGVANVELECHPPETILDAVTARRGQVDVFLLYAVLEHLTVSERLAVLRMARDVVRADGAIVVCETPNRLTYFDHHTAQMPFFHLLPDELALECFRDCAREDLKAGIEAGLRDGPEAGLQAIARWGRGVSFHEFEVAFGDLGSHVLASNYDPILFGERPVHPEEVVLARYLSRMRPTLAPVWSRAWLDLILSPHPVAKRAPFIWPWTAETVASADVAWTGFENLLLKGAGATLVVTLPQPTTRLVVGSVSQDDDWLLLYLQPDAAGPPQTTNHRAPAGRHAYTTFSFPEPVQRLSLAATKECHVVFIGYEA